MQASGTFLRVQSYTDLFESEYYHNLLIKPLYYVLIRKPLLLDMYGLYAIETGIYYRSVVRADVQLARRLQPHLQLQLQALQAQLQAVQLVIAVTIALDLPEIVGFHQKLNISFFGLSFWSALH